MMELFYCDKHDRTYWSHCISCKPNYCGVHDYEYRTHCPGCVYEERLEKKNMETRHLVKVDTKIGENEISYVCNHCDYSSARQISTCIKCGSYDISVYCYNEKEGAALIRIGVITR
jgi:hypothetical protein